MSDEIDDRFERLVQSIEKRILDATALAVVQVTQADHERRLVELKNSDDRINAKIDRLFTGTVVVFLTVVANIIITTARVHL